MFSSFENARYRFLAWNYPRNMILRENFQNFSIFASIHTYISLNQDQGSVFKLQECAQSIPRIKWAITFFTERFKKSAGYMAKCEVAPTARIRSRVQSRAEPLLFAVSKIDKKFCLGVFLAQKHEFDVFITPKAPKNEFFTKI